MFLLSEGNSTTSLELWEMNDQCNCDEDYSVKIDIQRLSESAFNTRCPSPLKCSRCEPAAVKLTVLSGRYSLAGEFFPEAAQIAYKMWEISAMTKVQVWPH